MTTPIPERQRGASGGACSRRWPFIVRSIRTLLECVVAPLLLLFMVGCHHSTDTSSLARALAEYADDLRKGQEPFPSSLALSNLIELGYLPAQATDEFGDISLEFFSNADEVFPQLMLMAAVMSDGSAVVAMGDGSVQQMTPQRYSAQKEAQAGQPDARANAAQPGRNW